MQYADVPARRCESTWMCWLQCFVLWDESYDYVFGGVWSINMHEKYNVGQIPSDSMKLGSHREAVC